MLSGSGSGARMFKAMDDIVAGLTFNRIKAAILAYPSYASDLGSMV